MQKKIEINAKTFDEAMSIAVAKLRASEEKIFINEISEGPEGKVYEALLDLNLALEGRKYLENILKSIGVEYNLEVRTIGNEDEFHFAIDSNENPLLIGAKGKTLEALQSLLKTLLVSYKNDAIVTLDVGNYRESRIRQLEVLATKTAKEVAKTKIDVKLKAMNSFERHVIHEKLSDWRDVYTESEGEGEDRAIVIKAKRN